MEAQSLVRGSLHIQYKYTENDKATNFHLMQVKSRWHLLW